MPLEKLTPTKFSAEKEMNGQNGPFKKIGFLTREHGDKKWFNISYNATNPLKEGQSYDLETKERQYTDKNGVAQTTFDAKLPSKESEMSRAIMNLGARFADFNKRLTALEVADRSRNISDSDIPVVSEPAFDESGAPLADVDLPF